MHTHVTRVVSLTVICVECYITDVHGNGLYTYGESAVSVLILKSVLWNCWITQCLKLNHGVNSWPGFSSESIYNSAFSWCKLLLNLSRLSTGLRHQLPHHQRAHGADVQAQAGGLHHSLHGGDRQGDQRDEAGRQLPSAYQRWRVLEKLLKL